MIVWLLHTLLRIICSIGYATENGALYRMENMHLQIITINLALSPIAFFVLVIQWRRCIECDIVEKSCCAYFSKMEMVMKMTFNQVEICETQFQVNDLLTALRMTLGQVEMC